MKIHTKLLILIVALCVAFLSTSCVTAGDLDRIGQAQEKYQERVERKLEELDKGTITPEEFRNSLDGARKDLNQDLERVKDTVKARTEEGINWVDILGGVFGLGGLGLAAHNRRSIRQTDEWVDEVEKKSNRGAA